jgi:hypothetical protein
VIVISLDASGLERAMGDLGANLGRFVEDGFEATLEAIAARAKQTTTFTDRTGLLRNSIQSEGASGSFAADGLEGAVGFAATAGEAASRAGRRPPRDRGFFYGLAQEFGTSRGVREKRFVRDAIDAQGPELIEDAIGAAFRHAGFEVVG